MTMKLDPASAQVLKRATSDIRAGMRQIASEAERDAHSMALIGAQAGIYGTVPGRVYQRTGYYLQSIFATGTVNAVGVELNVGDHAPYAYDLEYGLRGAPLPQAAAEQMATALGATPGSLYLGRTGRAYTTANPAITRATVFSSLRMINSFEGLMRFATR